MFDPQLKSTGRDYSLTIALAAGGILIIPAILMASRSSGSIALSVAALGSSVCLVLAWINWKLHSELTIPTMESAPRRKK